MSSGLCLQELLETPALRVHYKRVIECLLAKDYNCIEEFLGDEDILGYGYFELPSIHAIQGTYKMDSYKYKIDFK